MDNDDARRLTPTEQHERRRQVIRAHKRGRTRTQIAADVGLSYTAVSKTIDRYEAGGMAALAPQRRGRRQGQQRVLSAEQEAHIQHMICDHRPEQLKMDFALWSRAAVMQLIETHRTRMRHGLAGALGGQVPGALGVQPAKTHPPRV